jgi:NADH:ubiquinone oxidoreductase subunit 5 (subunit L)/multisubunit Na+/H+ antiporter MnhA subunit
MATLAFGAIGMLASQELGRLAGYSLLVSSGTLLAAISRGDGAVTAAALFYLMASTLGIAAFFLLIELVQRAREPGAEILAVTAEAFGLGDDDAEPEEQPGSVIPATMALLGLSFLCCALLVAGLPPLPGFVAKFALLAAVLGPQPVSAAAWMLIALLTISGLAAVVAMGRAGVHIFWASEERTTPRVRVIEIAPVAALLALCFALTVAAGPVMRYLQDAALALHSPQTYIDSVIPPPMKLFLALFALWLILNESLAPGHLLLGAALALGRRRGLQPAAAGREAGCATARAPRSCSSAWCWPTWCARTSPSRASCSGSARAIAPPASCRCRSSCAIPAGWRWWRASSPRPRAPAGCASTGRRTSSRSTFWTWSTSRPGSASSNSATERLLMEIFE